MNESYRVKRLAPIRLEAANYSIFAPPRNVAGLSPTMCDLLVCRARRSEARIQQMLWKVNYSDIVFIDTVCMPLN